MYKYDFVGSSIQASRDFWRGTMGDKGIGMKEVGYMSDEFHGRFEPPPASVRMIPNPQNSDTPHSKKQKHIL